MTHDEITTPAQREFDYSQLAPDVRGDVQGHTRRIRALERQTGEAIIEIGRELIAVKAKVGHGNFGPWLSAEFGWGDRTARRFMSVAEQFGDKTDTVADLGAKVLYALAAPNCSDEVRTEFIARAEAGDRITHRDVQDALAERQPARTFTIPTTITIPTTQEAVIERLNELDAEIEWLERAHTEYAALAEKYAALAADPEDVEAAVNQAAAALKDAVKGRWELARLMYEGTTSGEGDQPDDTRTTMEDYCQRVAAESGKRFPVSTGQRYKAMWSRYGVVGRHQGDDLPDWDDAYFEIGDPGQETTTC